MNAWLIAALIFVGSHVAAGFYWHHDGYSEAQRDAKAAQDDAVVAGISAANELAAADLKRAVAAERKRGDQRAAAAERSAGLQESIRTEVVYRDRDCRIPDADRVRINAALAAARQAREGTASRSDGAVSGADRPADARSAQPDGEAAGNGRGAGRVRGEAGRVE